MNRLSGFALGLSLFGCAAAANAQYGYGFFTYPSQTFVGTNIMAVTEEATRQVSNPPIARVSKPVSAQSNVTTFTPSAARTRANLAAFANKTRATDPEGAAKMDEMFASTDIIGAIGQAMATIGLKTNNVADAYAVYWVAAWQASRGDMSDASAQTYQSVKRQAANGMAAVPAMATATDAQKQEYAEAMLIQAAMIDSSKEVYENDPQMMQQLSAAVAKGAKAMGLDLDTMDLTPNGFVPAKGRKRSDAGDGAANSDTTFASNDAPNRDSAPSNPLATYALIAAAGGAGLGGVFLIGKAMGKKG